MRPCKAVETMLERSGTSKYALSKGIGRSRNYVGNTLDKDVDIGALNLACMADVMGYDLALLPRDGGEALTISEETPE